MCWTQLEILNKDVKMHIDIALEIPTDAEKDWSTLRCLNCLRTKVGWSIVSMEKWGYSDNPETHEYDEAQMMKELLVCQLQEAPKNVAISCGQQQKNL